MNIIINLFLILFAYLYATFLEWAIHKYVLHGLGKNKNSWFNFHWHSHHKTCRKNANQDDNYKTALRFINCLQPTDAKLKFRDEEVTISNQYFCRIRAGEMNFSNNPTFTSGSLNEVRHTTMKGNPATYISQVQLYNPRGDIVAVGNLSTPLKKNFSSEATIKVKLTY